MTMRTLDDRFQLIAGLLHKLQRLSETGSRPAAKVAALAAWFAAKDLEVIAHALDGERWEEVVDVLRTRQARKRGTTATRRQGRAP